MRQRANLFSTKSAIYNARPRLPNCLSSRLAFRTVWKIGSIHNTWMLVSLLAWHFRRFLDFTNNYNNRAKRACWGGSWRDEKKFEISIQFEFDGYWLDICSLWNNGILNVYYCAVLFWDGKRFNFMFDFLYRWN